MMVQYDFSGRRVLITGAAGGIGWDCARLLAAAGAELVLVDRDEKRLHELLEQLGTDRGHQTVAGDLVESATLQQVITIVEQGPGLDALIPAAGIYRDQPVAEMTWDQWRHTISVNLDAVFTVTQAVLPYLNDHASIVNFDSLAGARGSRTHAHYAATKAAVTAFGRSLALEVGHRGIRVNSVAPGIIRTSMTDRLVDGSGEALLAQTPLGRFGTAEEVASVVLFLCSDASSFINGEVIHINGGLYMQ
ncbi:SDR family NAD(P)-dependent oxidoreductase [Citricoccus sp. NR2]|uniref:SDR family NAD(P)-dependent oxidoreductase n=1 Tax=Citricoccus sp. NR2 TaxID=3004095 RepID=UPI0022DD986A|nr:SDR family NAD(P)-dependent oxidoreductase [Citricoccus sp. NR2]WBL19393.1 SDR family NAD(P)-dependent oxidoreductase [Citricoccus sp. NR2]